MSLLSNIRLFYFSSVSQFFLFLLSMIDSMLICVDIMCRYFDFSNITTCATVFFITKNKE